MKAASKSAPKTASKKTVSKKTKETEKSAPAPKASKKAPAKPAAKAAPKPAKTSAPQPYAPNDKLHDLILKTLNADKVADIVSIDLKDKTAIADYMVIASGTSSRQVSSAAAKLRDKLSAQGIKARVEGQGTGDWVIVDAGDVIVHLFRPEVRSFYNLEKLWGSDFSTVDFTLYKSS